jgi:hypothetical protein
MWKVSKSSDIPAHPKTTALRLSAVFALIFLGTFPSAFCSRETLNGEHIAF